MNYLNYMRIWPGKPYPLGANWDGMGVNFSIFSENAEKVELCLFDSPKAKKEYIRIEIPKCTNYIWHCYLPDIRPAQVYGYRVYGPYDPRRGLRFNPNKVLVDPYAKGIARLERWDSSMYGYRLGSPKEDLFFGKMDNVAYAPLCVVIDSSFIWGDDRPPHIPWSETIIYETHVKGLTMLHPEISPELRGTYLGLASEPVIRHLKDLGVTAVELMPIHHHVDDHHLVKLGLKNYWGYNTLSYFAPDLRYASKIQGNSDPVREFKMMVRTLHAAGMEVILDVVYNHTAEGNHLGPTLSFRGIDNPSYYRLSEHDPRLYEDFTGCGNTLNMHHSAVLQMIMDSLRYWILEMHVDGFRFDLASALARELYEVDKLSSFFDIIHQDPVISQVKLIAEPWDLGEGGYQVGNFPVLWTEWNAKYRDIVRKVWSSEHCMINEFATRLSGSSDLYEHTGRKPHASINFVTCHDGFTLKDIVSYNEKHNEANGEENRDGENYNISYNFGVEGPTDDPEINRRRRRQQRNLMATLMFSLGVPMILGGDELGRIQKGNNNAYCQDNEISWYNWKLEKEDKNFLNFVRKVISIRKRNPVFKRSDFFMGRPIRGSEMKDIAWLTPEGSEMADKDWNNPVTMAFGVLLGGDAMDEVDEMGYRITGDTIFMIINLNHTEEVSFILPEVNSGTIWERILDTYFDDMKMEGDIFPQGSSYILKEHSLALFRLSHLEGKGAPQFHNSGVLKSHSELVEE